MDLIEGTLRAYLQVPSYRMAELVALMGTRTVRAVGLDSYRLKARIQGVRVETHIGPDDLVEDARTQRLMRCAFGSWQRSLRCSRDCERAKRAMATLSGTLWSSPKCHSF
jgi:hypothetical protein